MSFIYLSLKPPSNNPVENLHTQFCRQLLGVQKNTTTIGVLLELGRTPLVLEAQKAAAKNLHRVKNGNANTVLMASIKDAEESSLRWYTDIKSLMERNGILNVLTETTPSKNAQNKILNRAKDIFHQNSFTTIKDIKSKLRTYALFKSKAGKEPYLTDIQSWKHRTSLSKFRLSNHKLRIEIGRREGLEDFERICQVCGNQVEDEIHFLINCHLYEIPRETLFEHCKVEKPNFFYYTDNQKFIYIMTSSTLTRALIDFLSVAFQRRDDFFNALDAHPEIPL